MGTNDINFKEAAIGVTKMVKKKAASTGDKKEAATSIARSVTKKIKKDSVSGGAEKKSVSKPKKKKGRGKSKGSNFERKICKELSHWVSKGKRDDLYWRSAMSGGRATIGLGQGIVRKGQMGDVTSIDKLGAVLIRDFVIELKHVKDLNIESGILYGTKGGLVTYWGKLLGECFASGKKPLLIGRSNNRPVVFIVDRVTGANLQNALSRKKKGKNAVSGSRLWSPGLDLAVFLLDEVVSDFTFKEFMSVLKIPKIKRKVILPKTQRGKKK